MPRHYTPTLQHVHLAPGDGIDVLGDIHGCMDEVEGMLGRLGYEMDLPADPDRIGTVFHPQGRRLFLVGDLVDRGPRNLDALRFLEALVRSGAGGAVIGNHDYKMLRHLCGAKVKFSFGGQQTAFELASLSPGRIGTLRDLLSGLPHQIIVHLPVADAGFPDGKVTIVHGAAPVHHQDSVSTASFERAMFAYPEAGPTTNGKFARADWAADYCGDRFVVHGHTVVPSADLRNRVLNLDTGLVFGGSLSAWQYPEGLVVEHPAHRVHFVKPEKDARE